jgi:hypothetical protein
MALPSSGTISLSQVQTEFGISGTVPLNALYRGGFYIANTINNQSVPTSGQISFNTLYNASNVFTFSINISANVQNYNLYSQAVSLGWNRTTPVFATVTINSGFYLGSSSTVNSALDTGPLPSLSEVYIVNNGYIVGAGGAGSMADSAVAYPGGTALRVQSVNTWVTNNGTIGGGGGGGGPGYTDTVYTPPVGKNPGYYTSYGGGGGGGGQGFVGGAAGAGNVANGGSNGKAGTYISPGSGGAGQPTGTSGGAGGTLGSAGVLSSGGNPGGAGGAAVVGNSTVTWRVTGTRLGSIS